MEPLTFQFKDGDEVDIQIGQWIWSHAERLYTEILDEEFTGPLTITIQRTKYQLDTLPILPPTEVEGLLKRGAKADKT